MVIKSKSWRIIVLFLLIFFWFTVCETVLAEGQAIVEFGGSPTYEHTKTITLGDTIRGYSFEIIISIKNTGTLTSQPISVNLSDEEGFSLVYPSSITLEPGETETVIFNWSTSLVRDQNVWISFFPADLNADRNQYNSGSTVLNIVIPKNDTTKKTPGFEIGIVIMSLLIITLLIKRIKK
jgi:hypothetical protein